MFNSSSGLKVLERAWRKGKELRLADSEGAAIVLGYRSVCVCCEVVRRLAVRWANILLYVLLVIQHRSGRAPARQWETSVCDKMSSQTLECERRVSCPSSSQTSLALSQSGQHNVSARPLSILNDSSASHTVSTKSCGLKQYSPSLADSHGVSSSCESNPQLGPGFWRYCPSFLPKTTNVRVGGGVHCTPGDVIPVAVNSLFSRFLRRTSVVVLGAVAREANKPSWCRMVARDIIVIRVHLGRCRSSQSEQVTFARGMLVTPCSVTSWEFFCLAESFVLTSPQLNHQRCLHTATCFTARLSDLPPAPGVYL